MKNKKVPLYLASLLAVTSLPLAAISQETASPAAKAAPRPAAASPATDAPAAPDAPVSAAPALKTVAPAGKVDAEAPAKAEPSDVAPKAAGDADRTEVDKMTADWPERPKAAVSQMIAQYGIPQNITADALVWHNQGRYKRIMVTKAEIPHDFPMPHMDFLEHTIDYMVPMNKAGAIITFDGSVTINRTAGEVSARCDLEGHNILTLNLMNDIATGKKSPEEARVAFGKAVVGDVKGEKPPYVTALQFEPSEKATRFADVPVIPGSPKRAMAEEVTAKAGKDGMGDGEIISMLAAINSNEILAAAAAQQKKVKGDVMDFAEMMQKEHGKNLEDSLKLGKKIEVKPLDSEAVDALKKKGAGELAELTKLEGEEFAAAYVDAQVKGHEEVLEMIDGKLLPAAGSDALKKHLTMTREAVAMHLEHAKKLQGGADKPVKPAKTE